MDEASMSIWVPLISELLIRDIKDGTLSMPKYVDEIDFIIKDFVYSYMGVEKMDITYPKTYRQIKYIIVKSIKGDIQDDKRKS